MHLVPGASHTAGAQEAQGRDPEVRMEPALPSLSVHGGFLVAFWWLRRWTAVCALICITFKVRKTRCLDFT